MVSKANVGRGGDNENPFECTALIKDGNTISRKGKWKTASESKMDISSNDTKRGVSVPA